MSKAIICRVCKQKYVPVPKKRICEFCNREYIVTSGNQRVCKRKTCKKRLRAEVDGAYREKHREKTREYNTNYVREKRGTKERKVKCRICKKKFKTRHRQKATCSKECSRINNVNQCRNRQIRIGGK